MPRPEDTIGSLLLTSAARHADRVALVDDRERIDYRRWVELADRVAAHLVSNRISPGQRVAILAADCVDALVAYLGVWLAGGVAVHLNARLAAPEVDYILEDADADGLLFTSQLSRTVNALSSTARLITASAVDSIRSQTARNSVLADRRWDCPADRAAIIGYTSGTSGRPKGAVVSHRALALCCRVAPLHTRMTFGGALAFTGSVSFVGTLWGQVLPHLYLGAKVRFLDHYDFDKWFAVMREDHSTFTYLPSPLIAGFTERIRQEPDILQWLVTVMHAGSIAPEHEVRDVVAATGGRYIDTYGSTEIVGSVTATTAATYRDDSPAERPFATAGLPLPAARLSIESLECGTARAGEMGRIVVESDTLFDGYWRAPEKSSAVLEGGRFDTGDLGYLDRSGHLYISGRRSDLIISGGMNVYPAEVERAISGDPRVRAVAVFGAPHERWGQGVVAAVVPAPGVLLSEQDVIEICRPQIASYKKPTRVLFVGELPYNASRKVDKNQLRALLDSGQRQAGDRPVPGA